MITNENTKRTRAARTVARPLPTAPAVSRESKCGGKATDRALDGGSNPALVEARIDVGPGNALFIRGEGEGLSWDKGQPLICVEPDRWIWAGQTEGKRTFKLLLNDQVWCQGDNMVLDTGLRLQITPCF